MKTKNKILTILFIVLVIYILYRIRTKKLLNETLVCYGNKCIYYHLGKEYEAKHVTYNKEGQRSFWGKYVFWYYYDNNMWKLIDNPKWNNPKLVEELNIPKEVEKL